MVGTGTLVEVQVRPFTKIAVSVGRDAGANASGDFSSRWTGEAGEIEGGPLCVGKGEVSGEGGELVEAAFVIGVAGEVGLGIG